jgi:hypothetical protein
MHRRDPPKLPHKERAIPPPQIKTGVSWRGFGENCQLIYAGRLGGSPGPDIRDAILNFRSHRSGTECAVANNRVENTTGDVEIHIRAFRRRA